MTKPDSPRPRLYGRRKGRPLRVRKSGLMKDLLPKVQIELPEIISEEVRCDPPPPVGGVRGGGVPPSAVSGLRMAPPPNLPRKGGGTPPLSFDPFSLFPSKPKDIWLEIGFGGGEHLAAQAKANPSTGFIGCEPFVNGIASLLDRLDREKLDNVRVFPNDARLLLDALPDASVARCFILFPDPWPKARHAERRFICPENLARLARVLRKGAELRLASDDAKLILWMRECLSEAKEFVVQSDSGTSPADWIPTRYEQKAVTGGRSPVYFSYRRLSDR